MEARTIALSLPTLRDVVRGPTDLSTVTMTHSGNSVSTDTESTSDTSTRIQTNTLGNRHRMPQCVRRDARSESRVASTANALSDFYTDGNLLEIFNNSGGCCDKNAAHGGCIQTIFRSEGSDAFDLFGALEFIHSARLERGKIVDAQLDAFIQEKVRCSVSEENVLANGNIQFRRKWVHRGHEVCRKTFSLLFNISKHKLDSCAAALKLSETRRVAAIKHKGYNDSHIHNYTYVETEEIMKTNLCSEIVGKFLFVTQKFSPADIQYLLQQMRRGVRRHWLQMPLHKRFWWSGSSVIFRNSVTERLTEKKQT